MDAIILTSDDEEDEGFDMQRAIADSLQSLAPAMGCQGRLGGQSKSQWMDDGQEGAKTWSQRRAEHAALKKIPSPASSACSKLVEPAVRISSDGGGSDDSDTLPDLDGIFPESDLAGGSHPLQNHRSAPTELLTMGSPRRIPNKERHFLDSFQPAIKYRRVKDETGPFRSKDVVVKSARTVSKTQSDSQLARKRKDRISQEMQAGSFPVCQQEYEVFKFPPDTSSNLSALERRTGSECDCRQLRNKFSGVRFLQDLTTYPSVLDRLCLDFVKMQTSCLDDLLDDLSDPTHFSNCMDLLEDFCNKRKPHPMLIDKIMDKGFFSAVDENMLVRTYHFVLKLWQRFPDLIKIDVQTVLMSGDVLQKHLQNSTSSPADSRSLPSSRKGRGGLVTGRPSVEQCRLYFQLFVRGLQLSLSQCTLADQKSVNKTVAFACLSSECSRPLMKQLTHWLEFCLVVVHQEHVAMAKLWMGELQTLLGVSVLVSRDRQEAAKKLAPDLKRTYKYLTDLSTKKRLLQGFSCPLLCFYVLRLVMEDQCESTIVSSQFPSSIQELIHNYYVALPPHDHLTPPPSPTEDGQEMAPGRSQMYSVQSCEELAMLVYFITKNFIACKQRRLNCDLRQEILKGPNLHPLTPEQKRHLQSSVQDFGGHLQALCSELSSATITYLSLLECLCLTS
ncbi:uncharacterized protein LOC143294220 [Babylonia areolata]|uniref:uncharacterized protein LOC143294220 n=1 Tax=Babylonia areolata TaxID=304850 RepID=UPI003FD633C0